MDWLKELDGRFEAILTPISSYYKVIINCIRILFNKRIVELLLYSSLEISETFKTELLVKWKAPWHVPLFNSLNFCSLKERLDNF